MERIGKSRLRSGNRIQGVNSHGHYICCLLVAFVKCRRLFDREVELWIVHHEGKPVFHFNCAELLPGCVEVVK